MIVAAEPTSTGSAVEVLAQAGVLGALVVLLGAFAYSAYRREVQRADRLEVENGRLRDGIAEKVIPLVERTLSTIEAARHERAATRAADRRDGT